MIENVNKKFGDIINEPDLGHLIDVNEKFSIWETYDKDPEVFNHIVIDTAGSPQIRYEDIPRIIDYLKLVYTVRVVVKNKKRIRQGWES